MHKAFLCPYNDEKALAALIQKHAPPTSGSELRFGNVCLGDDRLKIAKCFLLDHGTYLLSKAVTKGRYQIFGKFVDASGQSALIRKRCLPVGEKRSNSEETTLGLRLETRFGLSVRGTDRPTTLWRGFQLSTEKLTFQVEIDSAEVDLQRANRFVAVAGMMMRDGRIEGLTAPNQPKDPCDLVDDAARLDIIVSAGKP